MVGPKASDGFGFNSLRGVARDRRLCDVGRVVCLDLLCDQEGNRRFDAAVVYVTDLRSIHITYLI